MFSKKVTDDLKRASFIRAMFEQGNRLRKIHGAENVFDFSIGNPEVEPPEEVTDAMREIAESREAGMHRYMSNAGYDFVREAVASKLSRRCQMDIPPDNICMVCGAAAGLNVVFKSILNEGDRVVIFAPYFAEYKFYIQNAGGEPVVVETDSEFEIDPEAFEKALNPKVKAVLINSPNNPSGVIYGQDTLKAVSDIMEKKQKEYGTEIILVSDEPYNEIIYTDQQPPEVLSIFKNAIVVNSYSKSLALPGERIGYIAVSPRLENNTLLMEALVFCNRTLGFVNAPAIAQRIVAKAGDSSVDRRIYRERRDLLYNHLTSLGFECKKPDGAFYLFVKSPVEDDMEFIDTALKYNVLAVPGKGFGRAGYFRLSFCIDIDTIRRSLAAWDKIAAEYF